MNQARRFNIKVASVMLAFVLCVGLAFYGGRVYQNNVDKPLFTQYTPPAVAAAGAARTTGQTGSYFGATSSGSSQVQAAVAYATPPAGSASPSSGSGSKTSAGQATSGAGTSGRGSTAPLVPAAGRRAGSAKAPTAGKQETPSTSSANDPTGSPVSTAGAR
jgi:hypothetical protein